MLLFQDTSVFLNPKPTSHLLIRQLLGVPECRERLSLRLLKNWHKHKASYGIFLKCSPKNSKKSYRFLTFTQTKKDTKISEKKYREKS